MAGFLSLSVPSLGGKRTTKNKESRKGNNKTLYLALEIGIVLSQCCFWVPDPAHWGLEKCCTICIGLFYIVRPELKFHTAFCPSWHWNQAFRRSFYPIRPTAQWWQDVGGNTNFMAMNLLWQSANWTISFLVKGNIVWNSKAMKQAFHKGI